MAALGKTTPNLKLVTKSGGRAGSGSAAPGALEIIALQELVPAESRKVERMVSTVCPGSGILGVVATQRPWDLRPVVALASDNGPSMLRLFGPEVALSLNITARTKAVLTRLTNEKLIASGILEWGEFEGQLWFRRPVASKTVALLLQDNTPLTEHLCLAITKSLLLEVENWHAHGIVHGHITPANVVVTESGDAALIDPQVGAAFVQASIELALEEFPAGCDRSSYAGEILAGEALSPTSDVFGLGLVFDQLFSRLSLSGSGRTDVRPLIDLFRSMADPDSSRRPSLPKISRLLSSSLPSTSARRQARRDGEDADEQAGSVAKPTKIKTASKTAAPLGRTGVSSSLGKSEKISPGRIVKVKVAGAAPKAEERPPEISEPQAETPVAVESTPPATPKVESPAAPVQPAVAASTAPVQQAAPVHPASIFDPALNPQPAPFFSPGAFHYTQQGQSYPAYPAQPPYPFTAVQAPHSPHAMQQQMMPQGYTQPPMQQDAFFAQQSPFAQPVYQAVSQAPQVQPASLEQSKEPGQKNNTVFFALCGVLMLVALAFARSIFSSGGASVELGSTNEELKQQWHSMRPSLMIPVAEAAVQKSPNAAAENVIVTSALKGEITSNAVDIGLLRVAFDKHWERELRPEDRRAALALALSPLLQDRTPTDLAPVDTLHPGVILAVAASGGQQIGKLLSKTPASVLAQLQPPYGPAINKLLAGGEKLSCGDPAVRGLAHLGTHGIDNPEQLLTYLESNTGRNLRALAILLMQDPAGARKVLAVLLDHPNIKLENELIAWGRYWNVLDWKELNESDQLLVLSGIPPTQQLSPKNIGSLFSHPVPALRSYAIEKGMNQIAFKHPGAWSVLEQLKNQPNLLTPTQTMQLAGFLDAPDKPSVKTVRNWLESDPPVDMIAQLLIATYKEPQGTIIDSEFCRHLKLKGWTPNVETLKKLSVHPDELTRLFSYGKIYELRDQKARLDLLNQALKSEPNPAYRSQVESMIASVKLY